MAKGKISTIFGSAAEAVPINVKMCSVMTAQKRKTLVFVSRKGVLLSKKKNEFRWLFFPGQQPAWYSNSRAFWHRPYSAQSQPWANGALFF
jgi:hypothetical protein